MLKGIDNDDNHDYDSDDDVDVFWMICLLLCCFPAGLYG